MEESEVGSAGDSDTRVGEIGDLSLSERRGGIVIGENGSCLSCGVGRRDEKLKLGFAGRLRAEPDSRPPRLPLGAGTPVAIFALISH
jgi:hypothetical protein